MWDLNYFKYNFLKTTGMAFREDLLENDFEKLTETLLKDETPTFMYRDFQSRNVMLKDGNPYFIDFQGGRKGPVYYDVASFLWQAKANFPAALREELIWTYIRSLRKYQPVQEEDFSICCVSLSFSERCRCWVPMASEDILRKTSFYTEYTLCLEQP